MLYTVVFVFTKKEEGAKKVNNSNNGDILKEERREDLGSTEDEILQCVPTGSTSWLAAVTMCVAVPEKVLHLTFLPRQAATATQTGRPQVGWPSKPPFHVGKVLLDTTICC